MVPVPPPFLAPAGTVNVQVELELVVKTAGEMIHVPFNDVEVHFHLAQAT